MGKIIREENTRIAREITIIVIGMKTRVTIIEIEDTKQLEAPDPEEPTIITMSPKIISQGAIPGGSMII